MIISPNFTIEDIHKIRYENYENTKKLSHQEIIEKTRKDAEEGLKILSILKLKSKSN